MLGDDLDRFRRLVIDLLEISRDDGGDQGSREIVRIADLVRAAANATAGREVTTVAPEAEGLTLQADKRRLERVIANLVENAEDHAGGCKGVGVEAGGLGVIITVDDAGPGIAAEDRDRIFERFGRGETSRPRSRRRPRPGHRRPPRRMAPRHHPGHRPPRRRRPLHRRTTGQVCVMGIEGQEVYG